MDLTSGAAAPTPLTLGATAAAELAGVAAPAAEPPPGYVVLLADVDGVGARGKVVCARAARIATLIDAKQAREATSADVELAAPFHIILKD